MKARKLINPSLLQQLHSHHSIGVPIRRLHRDHQLNNISVPVFTSLLDAYTSYLKEDDDTIKKVMHDSLFPSWLDEIPVIQEQPQNWKYVGNFPYGAWLERS